MTVMLVVFTVMLVDREMAGIIILRLFGYFLCSILSSFFRDEQSEFLYLLLLNISTPIFCR